MVFNLIDPITLSTHFYDRRAWRNCWTAFRLPGRSLGQGLLIESLDHSGTHRRGHRQGSRRGTKSGKPLGGPKLDAKRERAVRDALAAGMGINRVARMVGTGNATVAAIAAKMRQGP
jgi:hypothetical protein